MNISIIRNFFFLLSDYVEFITIFWSQVPLFSVLQCIGKPKQRLPEKKVSLLNYNVFITLSFLGNYIGILHNFSPISEINQHVMSIKLYL